MATINLDIPDAAMPRIVDAFAVHYGWHPDLGVTKAVFAKRQLIEHLRLIVLTVEGSAADRQASAARAAIAAELAAVNIT